MIKKYSVIVVILSLLPQTALAHFETSHEPLWYEPMHWLTQHYQGMLLIGLGIVIAFMYLGNRSKEK